MTARRDLHRRAVAALTARPGVDPARVAHHAELAGDDRTLARAASRACHLAADRTAYREAVRHGERALSVGHALDPDERAELQVKLGHSLAACARVEEAGALLRAAVDHWHETGDDRREADALSRLGIVLGTAGRERRGDRRRRAGPHPARGPSARPGAGAGLPAPHVAAHAGSRPGPGRGLGRAGDRAGSSARRHLHAGPGADRQRDRRRDGWPARRPRPCPRGHGDRPAARSPGLGLRRPRARSAAGAANCGATTLRCRPSSRASPSTTSTASSSTAGTSWPGWHAASSTSASGARPSPHAREALGASWSGGIARFVALNTLGWLATTD